MDLQTLWFWLICLLWAEYFLLEGFDFGVGMLQPILGKDKQDRDQMLATIEPIWDGNEVWLLVAGGATFAAFPQWYATMFSGFYIALLLILVLLILRVISFEWRHKSDSPHWREFWRAMNVAASVGAPLIWGIALSSLLYGTPVNSDGHFTGTIVDLFNWYTVLAGIAVVLLFALHGATFLRLRTSGHLREGATRLSARLAPIGLVAGGAFLLATIIVAVDKNDKTVFPSVIAPILAAIAAVVAVGITRRGGRDGLAFAATGATIVLAVISLFAMLYPTVMVSSTSFADSLTIDSAASGHYTLTVMTVAMAILLPIVFLYQFWAHHVFRARLGHRATPSSPADLLGSKAADASGSADPT